MKPTVNWVTKIVAVTLFLLYAMTLSIPAEAKKTEAKRDYVSSSYGGQKVFVFNPKKLKWTLYANGKVVRTGRAVGGKKHCADVHRPCETPVGTFRIYSKAGPHFRSSKYPLPRGGASMPWAMFFHRGYAIHGSNEMPNRPASHGCIRVYPSDARWLSKTLPIGTKVIVQPR